MSQHLNTKSVVDLKSTSLMRHQCHDLHEVESIRKVQQSARNKADPPATPSNPRNPASLGWLRERSAYQVRPNCEIGCCEILVKGKGAYKPENLGGWDGGTRGQ